ncbi:hypothetical protein [Actinophytocola sp. KF-1]
MSTRSSRHDWRPDGMFPTGEAGERLATVLRAATAPAHPGELAGEAAAVAAFRAAAAEKAPGRPSKLRSVLAKVLTVKAVIVIAVAGSAGIVAAATGVLPAPWSPVPPAEQSNTSARPTAERSVATPTTSDAPRTARSSPDTDSTPEPTGRPAARGKTEPAGTPEDTAVTPTKPGKPEETGKPARPPVATPEKPGGDSHAPAMGKPENTDNTGQADNSRRPVPAPARPSTPDRAAHGTAGPPGGPTHLGSSSERKGHAGRV